MNDSNIDSIGACDIKIKLIISGSKLFQLFHVGQYCKTQLYVYRRVCLCVCVCRSAAASEITTKLSRNAHMYVYSCMYAVGVNTYDYIIIYHACMYVCFTFSAP